MYDITKEMPPENHMSESQSRSDGLRISLFNCQYQPATNKRSYGMIVSRLKVSLEKLKDFQKRVLRRTYKCFLGCSET